MDFNILVEEVTRRVMEKLKELEQTPCKISPEVCNASTPCEKTLDKKVIVERDIIDAQRNGITVLRLRKKSILTDLAKELAAKHQIQIIKEQ